MSLGDGGVVGVFPVHVSGSTADRFNIAITSEGYRWDQMWQFVEDAKHFAKRFFSTKPLDQLECKINIYRIDVWSLEAGCADPSVPGKCNGTGYDPATFYGSTFCQSEIERLVGVNQSLVEWVLATHAPWAHELVILVNASKQGGNGHPYATVTRGGGWDWAKVAIHELGHAAWGLGDEYDFLRSCDDTNRNYTGPEPAWPNVAKNVNRPDLKWGDLVKSETPLPTEPNADCTTCNPDPSGYPLDTVGAFEGAGLYHCGLYRAQEECLMRYADDFCSICSASIEADMAAFEPKCLAPVFDGASGWLCWLKRLFLSFGLAVLAPVMFHPAVSCAYKRLLFRLQHCEEGNSDPCIDLGHRLTVAPTFASVAYPKQPPLEPE